MAPTEVFHVEFVESAPGQLDEGTLYVSMRFATVIHLCACGCGTETVTPLDPTDYKLIYDGDTITLCPSIGNWQYPCRAHYFIRRNRVVWARDMTDQQIAAGRQKSQRAKELTYNKTPSADANFSTTPTEVSQSQRPGGVALVCKRLVARVRGRTP
jgi:hypothetical protein